MKVKGRIRARTALPVSGVPLRGRVNPYVAAPYSHVEVYVEVGPAERAEARVEGPSARLLETAAAKLAEALGEGFELRMALRLSTAHPEISVYSSAVPVVIEAVARLLGVELGKDEVLEYSSIVDGAVGLSPEYVDIAAALRLAQAGDGPVAYRRGEEPVPLPRGLEVEVLGCTDVREPLEEPEELRDALTHLAGLATLSFADALRRRDSSSLEGASRVENAVWYAVYGVRPPPGDAKVIPDIGGVCFARLRI